MGKHRHFWRNQRGAAVAEYGLIAAILGAAIAVASLALGSAVSTAIEANGVCPSGQASC